MKKAYILSGGKSTRMGADKGLQPLGGKPLIGYLIASLHALKFEISIVAHHPDYRSFRLPILTDIIKDKGPMGGIFTALSDAREDALILSVDTPFLSEAHLLELKNQHQAGKITMLVSEGKRYPLYAIYPFRLLEALKKNIQKEHLKLMPFLDEQTLHSVEVRLSQLEQLNLNTPQDVETAKYLLHL